MTPGLSGHFSTFGLVFFVLKSLLGIARQWIREKFAIFSLKPRSHVRISRYRTCSIGPHCLVSLLKLLWILQMLWRQRGLIDINVKEKKYCHHFGISSIKFVSLLYYNSSGEDEEAERWFHTGILYRYWVTAFFSVKKSMWMSMKMVLRFTFTFPYIILQYP